MAHESYSWVKFKVHKPHISSAFPLKFNHKKATKRNIWVNPLIKTEKRQLGINKDYLDREKTPKH